MQMPASRSLSRSVLFLISTYATTFATVQLTQRFVASTSLVPLGAMVSLQILALAVAIKIGERVAGYLVGCFAATLFAELVIQAVKSLHSAPVHYAVALAAGFGVWIGVLVARQPSAKRDFPNSLSHAAGGEVLRPTT